MSEELLAAVDASIRALLAYLDKRCPETFEAMVVAGHKLREERERQQLGGQSCQA